jgi:hypothetical protein
MKIAIIGIGRSRSTLLAQYIHSQNRRLDLYYEHYTYALKHQGNNLNSITNELSNGDNFIVKIMGHNLNGHTGELNVFNFSMYNEIHLIERNSFFDQCCSLQVSLDTGVWHKLAGLEKSAKEYEQIKKQKFLLQQSTIFGMARDLVNYLLIKKYLLENGIVFKLHTYDSVKKFATQQSVLANPNLDYQNIIINYYMKEKIDQLFTDSFSLSEARSNLDLFKSGVIDG